MDADSRLDANLLLRRVSAYTDVSTLTNVNVSVISENVRNRHSEGVQNMQVSHRAHTKHVLKSKCIRALITNCLLSSPSLCPLPQSAHGWLATVLCINISLILISAGLQLSSRKLHQGFRTVCYRNHFM